MVLILSKSKFEMSTEEIMDWLDFKEAPYYRLNGDDFNGSIEIDENGSFQIQGLDLSKVNIVWYRRWLNEDYISRLTTGHPFIDDENFMSFTRNLNGEIRIARGYLNNELKNANWLTYPHETGINKLTALAKARELGIQVPETIITSSKSKLLDFRSKHPLIITKPISDSLMLNELVEKEDGESYNTNYSVKTAIIDSKVIDGIADSFFPSLFQELIEKEYEIRSFYLDGKFYSMVIFSQLDETTSVDFRVYNKKRPNRTVPYLLPKSLERKLQNLMISLNLTTGSIDLIKDKKGDYIFLEVNPVGQFGMTSKPCNYYLEEILTDYLIKLSKYEI